MNNLITDLDGVLVGSAEDERVASGVSVVIFEEPAIASIAIHGGAPGVHIERGARRAPVSRP